MKDGTTLTIGLVCILISLPIWYWSAWLRIFKDSDTGCGATASFGFLINIYGYAFVVDWKLLNEYQVSFALLVHFAHVLIPCL